MEPIDDWVRREEFVPKRSSSPADKPPPGYHYDPYRKCWRRNLTEAEVQDLWPYKKDTNVTDKVVSTKKLWRAEDTEAAQRMAEGWGKGELHAPPQGRRMLGPDDTSQPPVLMGYDPVPAPKPVTKETAEMAAEVVAAANVMAASKAGDNVHLPQHYARYKIEPIRFSIENGLDGFQFNIIKYVCRHPFKNKREDLRKAMRYLEMYIKYTYDKDPDWWR